MKDALKNLATAVVAFVAPIQQLLVMTGALIGFDLLTGILAARKRGERISSSRLKDTVIKCLVYQVAIISGFIVQQHFIPDLPVVKLVSAVIGMTELKSILENVETITEVDFMRVIASKMNSAVSGKKRKKNR